MATATADQKTVRWYVDDSSDPDTMTAYASEADSATEGNVSRAPGTSYRLVGRVLIQNDASATWNSAAQWQYNYKPDGGSYGGWTTLNASSSPIKTTGGTPADHASCDTSTLTGGLNTFETDGTYDEDDGIPVTPNLAKNNHCELAICVYLDGGVVSENDILAVRLQSAGIATYTNVLYVTVAAAAATTNVGWSGAGVW